ncbi:hypothetical protein [Ferruginibacter sp. HRS2-29]|uniref:hypothetical protein n=1 Tax=Ferruginibacter sp. HRS2-29 TaxID=2487334 RepID=UPI0020CD3649|nr:hypothetical protein [Ferruginibacter sp. HRS2-29]MCP9753387.1 hypothetical protein [Ferruginibacter sp. HRS2-29]
MKTSTVGIVTPINKDELKELLTETKETLATGILANAGNPTFGAVDLWKLRKTNKTTSSLRRHI